MKERRMEMERKKKEEEVGSQVEQCDEDVVEQEKLTWSIHLPTFDTTIVMKMDNMEIEAPTSNIIPRPLKVNVNLQWPKDCENPKTNKEFIVYLSNYIHRGDFRDGQQLPPESVVEGEKWNMVSYHKFLKSYFTIRKSRIHDFGCFLNEGCCIDEGDLLIYSGFLYRTNTDDGNELEIHLNSSPNSDKKLRRSLYPQPKGVIVSNESDEGTNDDVPIIVYIRPGENDILKYMNDMLIYGDNALEGLEKYSFVLQVKRMIHGVSEKSRKHAYSKNNSGLTWQKVDSVGELTLYYGEFYEFKRSRKEARALVIDETYDSSSRSKKARVSTKKKILRTPPKRKRKFEDNNDGDEDQDMILYDVTRKLFDDMVATDCCKTIEDCAQIDWLSDDSDEDTTSSPVRSTQRNIANQIADKNILHYIDNSYFVDCFAIPPKVRKEAGDSNFYTLVDNVLRKLEPPLSRHLVRLSFSVEEAKNLDTGLKDTQSERFKTFMSLRELATSFQEEVNKFIELANIYLYENNTIEITFTDPDLVSIPITRNNIPPLVHSSRNSECSCKQFDFIAYCFLENVTLDIRDCYKVVL